MRNALLWPAISLMMLGAAPAGADTLSDGQILGIYIQVNSFDIETALVAQAQAESDSVRSLAAHVASDHAGVRGTAYALAETCHAPPVLPSERNAAAMEHAAAMVKLLALHGTQFDGEYLRREVAFHRSAIAAVKSTLLPAAQCAELKAHLQAVLPAFEQHLVQTEALAAKK